MRIFPIFLVLFFCSLAQAANIEGVVKDAQTGETLIGANVYIKNSRNNGTTTGLDGTFVLKTVSEDSVVVVCSYISYQPVEKVIDASSAKSGKIDFNLSTYENKLQDVVIAATNKTTDLSSRTFERMSSNVVNAVGARSIEISPDLNVANVLGRMSGVTLERNQSGEAEYAVLRGMDKRYNITLVNGAKISSPNNKQRYVPLNIFPSDLLDRLEVSKSRSAEIEGDATGGAINMVMKDAPSRLSVRANFAMGYNFLFSDQPFTTFDLQNVLKITPFENNGKSYLASMNDFGNAFNAPIERNPTPNMVAGISVGNRVLNNKLGFILAANYQNNNKGANSTYFESEMLQTESTMRITSVKKRDYSENQQQYGVHAKFDYSISNNSKIEWYNFYVANNNAQVRKSESTNFKLFYEPDSGNLDLSYQTRLRVHNQYVLASQFMGDHQLGEKMHLNWSAIYSNAGLERPDQTYVNLDNLRQNYVDNINIDGDGSERQWEHNSDRDLSANANLDYIMPLKSGKLKLQTGGLFRNKQRDNFFVSYKFKPVNTNQDFETIDQIKWSLYTPKGSVNPLTYGASESVGSGYLQGKYTDTNIEAITGVRVEYINQGYTMVYPNAGEPADGGQQYTDILPNVLLKYSPNAKMNWRAIYFRSINRPGFFEIVPYQMIEEEFTEYGNKNLKRTHIDNVDFRWEYFPKPLDQLLIGAFYKNINSPIEYAYYSVNQRQSGYGFQNLGNAQNYGIEVDVIKYIRFLGVKANYTYTHSAITTPKVYYGKDANGNAKTFTTNQTRALVGQASHVANVSLLVKDVKYGWDMQLAGTYTGDKIIVASRFLDSDLWERGGVQLDASMEKSFKKGLSLFAKASNLTNAANEVFLKTKNSYNNQFALQSASANGTIIRRDFYRQSFLVGIRYKY